MIAKLVSLYDFENQEGISSCKLGGGDFMLPKGWEKQKPTIENTLNNLYLIAAREKIKCSFDKYISIIKDEFSRATIAVKIFVVLAIGNFLSLSFSYNSQFLVHFQHCKEGSLWHLYLANLEFLDHLYPKAIAHLGCNELKSICMNLLWNIHLITLKPGAVYPSPSPCPKQNLFPSISTQYGCSSTLNPSSCSK